MAQYSGNSHEDDPLTNQAKPGMAHVTSSPYCLITQRILSTITKMANDVFSIRCYICENERSNTYCMGEFKLETCEEGLDTCQTIVSYSEVSNKRTIIKTCTKNVSCEMQVNATHDVMPCDRSLGSWVCTRCCQDDACNLDSAPGLNLPYMEVLVTAMALSLILRFCS